MTNKINSPNINTKIPHGKRDFYEKFENQKPNSDKYRKGWDKIYGKLKRSKIL